jgi:hypothetical protein
MEILFPSQSCSRREPVTTGRIAGPPTGPSVSLTPKHEAELLQSNSGHRLSSRALSLPTHTCALHTLIAAHLHPIFYPYFLIRESRSRDFSLQQPYLVYLFSHISLPHGGCDGAGHAYIHGIIGFHDITAVVRVLHQKQWFTRFIFTFSALILAPRASFALF